MFETQTEQKFDMYYKAVENSIFLIMVLDTKNPRKGYFIYIVLQW